MDLEQLQVLTANEQPMWDVDYSKIHVRWNKLQSTFLNIKILYNHPVYCPLLRMSHYGVIMRLVWGKQSLLWVYLDWIITVCHEAFLTMLPNWMKKYFEMKSEKPNGISSPKRMIINDMVLTLPYTHRNCNKLHTLSMNMSMLFI